MVRGCHTAGRQPFNFAGCCSKKHPTKTGPDHHTRGRSEIKLVRYGAIGQEKPGLIDKSGQLRDLSAHVKDFTGDAFSPASLAKIAALDSANLPAVGAKPRIGAPVGGLPKFIAIGLNYTDHAAEVGMPIPAEPIIFIKANNSLCGPNDAIAQP